MAVMLICSSLRRRLVGRMYYLLVQERLSVTFRDHGWSMTPSTGDNLRQVVTQNLTEQPGIIFQLQWEFMA